MANVFQTRSAIATSLQTSNCAQNLGEATQNILENAFYIAKQKLELSRKAYKQLIKEWGWEKEDKKYLKLAKTFEKFSPSDLAEIEPNTLFLLSNQSKKYAAVIEQLLDIGYITQKKVRELIKQQRKPKPIKVEKPSIWRRTKNGLRYCQVPPIHDQAVGVALQKMMDEEGLTAQQIIAEALELRQALKEGRLNVESQNQETEDIQVSSAKVVQSDEYLENQSQEVVYEDIFDNEPSFEIDNSEAKQDYTIFSDNVIFNPTTNQETVEFLSEQLFVAVENLNYFGRKEVKEAEQLVASIIDFCNSQPASEQWNTLAQITRRNSKALMVVVGYSGKEHSEWFFNLPQILADAALDNPEELDWVDKRLRSEALLLISGR
ncbi:hypothetical protein Riv7116_6291 [Rivularia sp. PCC 7116]|uniref:hypothetical protein n=1 Tax=Rivularia sp. PCC 7116 TaxID=373994 RepID=UPI00029EF9F0|nr:hypothetical protein [Rivularia sp. PCC 7116]AFY58638.1 hypothetical protein Riv7116_6291 [Rivularia sp. PCC 7116]